MSPQPGNRTRRLVVVTAGLSQPPSTRLLADRLDESARDQLTSQGFHAEVTVIDVRNHAHEVVDNQGRLTENGQMVVAGADSGSNHNHFGLF